MDKDLKQRWIEALESGDYKKGSYTLCREGEEYCCLGVLAEIEGKLDDYKQAGINQNQYKGYLNDGDFGLSLFLQGNIGMVNDAADDFGPAIEYIKEYV